MKKCIRTLFLPPLVVAVFDLMMAGQVAAQTFKTLHSFTATSTNALGVFTNSDGAAPNGLVLSGTVLYGRAEVGGSSGKGSVFSINIDGSGFTVLHEFTGAMNDGAYAEGLLVSNNTLFGTTSGGGNYGGGTVFAMNTDGTAFKILHNFGGGGDGAVPTPQLVLSDHTLYGTTESGGGTLFAVNTDGSGFRALHSFTGASGGFLYNGGLLVSSNTLYGTAIEDGSWGSIFMINTDGTGFANLLSFTQTNDVVYPFGRLHLSGAFLYGTAHLHNPIQTVFRARTDGTGAVILYTARRLEDGLSVIGLSANTLYCLSGSILQGSVLTLFAINGDGSGFTELYRFSLSDISLVEWPSVSVLSGGTFYGTTLHSLNLPANDRIFSISMSPQLNLAADGNNMVLTWPTNYAGFDYSGYTLQATTNLGSSEVWSTNSTPQVVVNGQNVVTNPITGRQQFFRLSQ